MGRRTKQRTVRSRPEEALTRQKRLMVSRSGDVALTEFVARLAKRLRTPVRASHLLRACLVIIHHAEQEILREAGRVSVARPPNDRIATLGVFERRLASMLLAGLRKSRALQEQAGHRVV